MSDEGPSVLLVDDDAMVRGWLRLAIADAGIRIAGEATTAAEALELAHRRRADLVLVDYQLGSALGTDVVRGLRLQGVEAPAVLMTANPVEGLNELAREAGAQGTVLKTGRADEVVEALQAVRRGETSFDSRHPRRPAGLVALSPREREILRGIAAGKTNREIAEELGIGDETVKTLLARASAKLGARRRAEAVAEAQRRRLL